MILKDFRNIVEAALDEVTLFFDLCNTGAIDCVVSLKPQQLASKFFHTVIKRVGKSISAL